MVKNRGFLREATPADLARAKDRATGGRKGGGSDDQLEREAQSTLQVRGLPVNSENMARARVFVKQRDDALKIIDDVFKERVESGLFLPEHAQQAFAFAQREFDEEFWQEKKTPRAAALTAMARAKQRFPGGFAEDEEQEFWNEFAGDTARLDDQAGEAGARQVQTGRQGQGQQQGQQQGQGQGRRQPTQGHALLGVTEDGRQITAPKKVWNGNELVQWLMKNQDVSQQEATDIVIQFKERRKQGQGQGNSNDG